MATIKPTLIADEIKSAFRELGTGPQAPQTNREDEAAAWEYAVASELSRQAKTRKKQAEIAAIEAGVLPDKLYPPGTNEVVWEGQFVAVSLRVNQPSSSIDIDEFIKGLRASKVKQSVIDDALAGAQRTNKPPQLYNAIFRSARNGTTTSR